MTFEITKWWEKLIDAVSIKSLMENTATPLRVESTKTPGAFIDKVPANILLLFVTWFAARREIVELVVVVPGERMRVLWQTVQSNNRRR